jgi:hypothetical protein
MKKSNIFLHIHAGMPSRIVHSMKTHNMYANAVDVIAVHAKAMHSRRKCEILAHCHLPAIVLKLVFIDSQS